MSVDVNAAVFECRRGVCVCVCVCVCVGLNITQTSCFYKMTFQRQETRYDTKTRDTVRPAGPPHQYINNHVKPKQAANQSVGR